MYLQQNTLELVYYLSVAALEQEHHTTGPKQH